MNTHKSLQRSLCGHFAADASCGTWPAQPQPSFNPSENIRGGRASARAPHCAALPAAPALVATAQSPVQQLLISPVPSSTRSRRVLASLPRCQRRASRRKLRLKTGDQRCTRTTWRPAATTPPSPTALGGPTLPLSSRGLTRRLAPSISGPHLNDAIARGHTFLPPLKTRDPRTHPIWQRDSSRWRRCSARLPVSRHRIMPARHVLRSSRRWHRARARHRWAVTPVDSQHTRLRGTSILFSGL